MYAEGNGELRNTKQQIGFTTIKSLNTTGECHQLYLIKVHWLGKIYEFDFSIHIHHHSLHSPSHLPHSLHLHP